jgi:hypothetical protein
MIVRGWAMTKTFRHPSVILEKRTQKSRLGFNLLAQGSWEAKV